MKREEFEALSPEEQEKAFLQLPFREKSELIVYSHDPRHLTRVLSAEEFYLMTREMDAEERSEVVQYANMEQLLFTSDIDCWEKDRISPKGFIQWLEVLVNADENRLLAWMDEMDHETILTGMMKFIQVVKHDWEYPIDEVLGDKPYFTLDDRYFILAEEDNLDTVRRVIEHLFENRRGRYASLLEGTLSELEDELEEEAYRKRGMRLSERGFPEPERAKLIYRPISDEEFEKFPLKDLYRNLSDKEKGKTSPSSEHPMPWSGDRLFLDEALLLFQSEFIEVREGLKEELMWLSNKVLACEGIDFVSEERVRTGVRRARRFVNIGLESLCGRDLEAARKVLSERWLEIVFRRGVGRLLSLREETFPIVKHYWKESGKAFLEFLNFPYDLIFRGILQTIPECFDPEVKDRTYPLRDFRSLDEIDKVHVAIQQIDKVHVLLNKKFSELFHRLNLESRRGKEPVTLFSLLVTLFISWVLTGKFSIQPLPGEKIRSFLEKSFDPAPSGTVRVLKAELKKEFLVAFLQPEDRTLLLSLWATVFQKLQEELGSLDPKAGLDKRYVSILPVI